MIMMWGHSRGTPPDHKEKQPFAPYNGFTHSSSSTLIHFIYFLANNLPTSTISYALQPRDQSDEYIKPIPEKIVLAAPCKMLEAGK